MPDTRIILETSLQSSSGLPKDQFENVWHFVDVTGGPPADVARTGCDKIMDFYLTGSVADSRAVSEFLTESVGPNIMTIKAYDFAAATPRPELGVLTFTTLAAGANSLPEEVALCISYYTDRNLPKKRGRLYIGPLATNALAASSHNPARPLPEFMRAMAEGGGRLITIGEPVITHAPLTSTLGTTTAPGTAWALYSPTLGTFSAIEHGWVDNEWDGQSRRRVEASARILFP